MRLSGYRCFPFRQSHHSLLNSGVTDLSHSNSDQMSLLVSRVDVIEGRDCAHLPVAAREAVRPAHFRSYSHYVPMFISSLHHYALFTFVQSWTGVCTNATAPSVSSINRILRNRAAERAAAEFARNYQLAAAATAASVHYPMPPPPPSAVHPFAGAGESNVSLLNAHKCRKLKVIRSPSFVLVCK